jgi:hypothetical protein
MSYLIINLKYYLILDWDKLLVCTCNFILCIYEELFPIQIVCTCKFDFHLMFS